MWEGGGALPRTMMRAKLVDRVSILRGMVVRIGVWHMGSAWPIASFDALQLLGVYEGWHGFLHYHMR